VEVAVSAPGLEGGCAPAAVDVVGGDCACELKTPSAEPIGELRSMIKPTAARRTASASASVRRTLQLRSAVSTRRAQGRELRRRVARPARVTRRPAGEPSLRPRNLSPKSPLPGAGFVAWPPWQDWSSSRMVLLPGPCDLVTHGLKGAVDARGPAADRRDGCGYGVNRVDLEALEHARVDVRGSRDGRVPEQLRNDFEIDPASDLERLVPRVGVEPTRGCPRRFLRPLRLPFRHPGVAEASFSRPRWLSTAPGGGRPAGPCYTRRRHPANHDRP
jgi:hypothetical protein